MKTIRKLLCCLLVTALLLPLAGCSTKMQKINWDLYGTWVTESGEIGKTVHFSIEGEWDIADIEAMEYQAVDFRIQWPDGFVYSDQNSPPSSVFVYETEAGELWLQCCNISYSPINNRSAAEVFYLYPERETAVFSWSDRDGNYLVASTDPDADPQEILAFFDSLID